MRILGIDLAAQPTDTGVIVLEVGGDGLPTVLLVPEPGTDDGLVELARGADLVGIDAPLGWPVNFVAAVSAHERLEPWLGTVDRTNLCFRQTDRAVWAATGKWPLSVSADKLGIVAMRCALLQERLAREVWDGERQPRDGTGRLVETYPGGTLRALGLPAVGYKGDRDGRRALREQIVQGLDPLVEFVDARSECIENDDTLDAVLSALTAWKASRGETRHPDEDAAPFARIEGWIHLPLNAESWT